MSDRTFIITRLFNPELVNMATRALDDSPFGSLIGQWKRLLHMISDGGPPLSRTATNQRHGEDDEKSLRANIDDRHAELKHWMNISTDPQDACECLFVHDGEK